MRKRATERPVLPASLLVAGRSCLVVGGGAIAARKVGHLLDAEADVTVVAPRATAELGALAAGGRIRLLSRPFADRDVRDRYLVIAATDRPAVNRRVVACCRGRRTWCSAADANWPDGDFVTPAICRKAGVIVTVSTGGRSCRLARLVRDRLAEALEGIGERPGRAVRPGRRAKTDPQPRTPRSGSHDPA
jgi:siroheme synthase-like protein